MTGSPARAATRVRTGRAAVLLAAAAVAAVDLAVKAAAQAWLAGSPVDLVVLQLRLAFNPGVAFSLGDRLPPAAVVALTAAISGALATYAWRRAPRAGWVERIAGGAVLGGAVANVVDRARDGVVTDYLHTGWWPTFNLADVAIVTGAAVLAVVSLIAPGPHRRSGGDGGRDEPVPADPPQADKPTRQP